jgi:uncharacterized OB-fold protein
MSRNTACKEECGKITAPPVAYVQKCFLVITMTIDNIKTIISDLTNNSYD